MLGGLFSALICLGIFLFLFVLPLISSMVVIIYEFERGVHFRLGKYVRVLEPGLKIIVPILDRVIKIDIRERPLQVPPQEIITKDNVTVKVNAVVYFKVYDAEKAFIEISDYYEAVSQLAQTTLRNVVGQSELDHILTKREDINEQIREIVDEHTVRWGIKITLVEIKDIELPAEMQRAMARQAEAERERRAKIIHAEGEYQAAKKLTEAAEIMARNPVALQLRFLQVIQDISIENTSTIVLPIPIELLRFFKIDSPQTNQKDLTN